MVTREALRKLHESRKIRARLLPGMAGSVWFGVDDVHAARCDDNLDWHQLRGPRNGPAWRYHVVEFDLTDPATVGCLLALLREAFPTAPVSAIYDPMVGWVIGRGQHGEITVLGSPLGHSTEGEAIAAALIALAEAL